MREKRDGVRRCRPCGRRLMSAALAVLMAVGAGSMAPRTAFGAEEGATPAPTVAGVDFLEPTAERWEVLRADGLGSGAVYLDVDRVEGGKATPLLKRQRYGGALGEGEPSPEIAQIIGLGPQNPDGSAATPLDAMASLEDHPVYTVAVYDAARAGAELFRGTVYPVYAALAADDGSVRHELMGLRTTDAPAVPKNLGVGETYYALAEGAGDAADRMAYELVRTDGADNRFDADRACFLVDYRPVESDSISGSVVYVDGEGSVVRTDAVPGIAGEGKRVPIEKSFFVDGDYYRVIGQWTGDEVLLTPLQATRTVRVMKVDGLTANAYEVTVRYTDQDGALLWSDSLDVKGAGYQYTLPQAFSMRGTDGVNYYTLDEVAPDADGKARSGHWWGNPLLFDGTVPADAFGTDAQGKRTLTARYTSSAVTKEATLTIVEVDGATGAELGRVALPVTPEREAVYEASARTIGGTAYVPWSGHGEPIRCVWDDLQKGVDLLQYVYYVPEGFVPSEAYDITVQYLNVANGAVLHRKTIAVDPELNDYVSIIGEPRIMRDGREYVRLAGQEAAIRHAYFSPTRTYTVYYRDVNDDLSAPIVVNRTQIVETERTVTVPGTTVVAAAPVPVAAPAADGGAAAPAGAPATVDAGVGPGDGAAIINDDDNPLAAPDGTDTTVQRAIADNETPLAAPDGAEGDADPNVALAWTAGLGVLGLAPAIGLLWWHRRRRGGENDGESAEA